MKKIVFILGFFTFFSLSTTIKAHAEESFPSPENSVVYDIEKGGLQQFEVEGDLGEAYIIKVEEESHFLRAASSVSNGTYKVTKERSLQWKVSYKIDVKGNAITRAHSPSITNYLGSVRNSSLKVDNTKQATYYINMTILTLNSSVNVRAKLQNNSIIVTY